jgi:hypothetical protein
MNMKKMYKKPNVETTEIQSISVLMGGSIVVNNDPIDPSEVGVADAPSRRTPVF